MRLGMTGKLMAEDALDRLTTLATQLWESASELSSGPRSGIVNKYISFLKNELEKFESRAA